MTLERTDPDDVYTPVGELYTQVIRGAADELLFVSGTVPENRDRELVGVGDMNAQIAQVMDNVERSLAAEGATLSDVVRTRIFTTDMESYMAADRSVLGRFPEDAKPTSTLVEVSRLADSFGGVADGEPTDVSPRYLVEVDVTAIVD